MSLLYNLKLIPLVVGIKIIQEINMEGKSLRANQVLSTFQEYLTSHAQDMQRDYLCLARAEQGGSIDSDSDDSADKSGNNDGNDDNDSDGDDDTALTQEIMTEIKRENERNEKILKKRKM
jgi:hypothetical protein